MSVMVVMEPGNLTVAERQSRHASQVFQTEQNHCHINTDVSLNDRCPLDKRIFRLTEIVMSGV